MKILLSSVLLLSTLNVLATEVKAPFGFEWGQSQKEILDKKVPLAKCFTKSRVTGCSTDEPIKSVSFGETYVLYFDDEIGLQKIKMVSKNITSDITGSKGKALYDKIKQSITKKYKDPETFEEVGLKLYDEYDEFYQCLKYDGCGSWFAYWEVKNGGNTVAKLMGLKRGVGYLELTYESKEWTGIVDSLNSRKEAADEDAL